MESRYSPFTARFIREAFHTTIMRSTPMGPVLGMAYTAVMMEISKAVTTMRVPVGNMLEGHGIAGDCFFLFFEHACEGSDRS